MDIKRPKGYCKQVFPQARISTKTKQVSARVRLGNRMLFSGLLRVRTPRALAFQTSAVKAEMPVCEPHAILPVCPQAACRSQTPFLSWKLPLACASHRTTVPGGGTLWSHNETTEPGQAFLRIFAWLPRVMRSLV